MSEHLTPSAWDRLMDKIQRPWTSRLQELEDAAAELRQVDRNFDRLLFLDKQIRRLAEARDGARRDLVALDRRRDLAIQRAVEEAGASAKWNRTRKMEAARRRETDWQDEATAATRRTITSRLATAERELANLREELAPIGLDPVLRDEVLVDWLRMLLGTVQQTQQRDREARDRVLGPWDRHRERSQAVAHRLTEIAGDDVVLHQAFGEGAIHVVAGARLAVVEVREGRGNVRMEDIAGTVTLSEVHPDGDRPLGVTDGSTGRLREAVQRVAGATGGRPAPVIVITGWIDAPQVTGGVVLCGPGNLAAVLEALPATDHSPSDLANAAGQLAQMPLPVFPLELPPSLGHLRPIEPTDVPLTLPALRSLVESARRPQPRAAHSRERVAA